MMHGCKPRNNDWTKRRLGVWTCKLSSIHQPNGGLLWQECITRFLAFHEHPSGYLLEFDFITTLFPSLVLLSFGEVLINSIVLSLCLPRAFYCVNVSVCKERVTLKVPLKSKTISGGYELANVEVVDPISMVSYLWNDMGYGSVKMKLNNIGTTIESLVPAGLCIQGLPARLCIGLVWGFS